MLFLFSFWHPYDSDVGMFKVVPEFLQPLHIFFQFLFLHSIPVQCLFLPFVPNCLFESQFPSLHFVGSLYILLYFTLCSIHFLIYFATTLNHFCEHPVTSVLNSASDRLSMSSSLSSFSGALISSFTWAIFLCLSAAAVLSGMELQSLTRARLPTLLWCGAVCGGGVREETVPIACLSPHFPSLPSFS